MPTPDKRIRVALVDDHAMVREGLRMLIQRHAAMQVVGEAASREAALALVARERPDILLLDLDLGQESGLDFLPELTQAAEPVRVIVLTGARDPEAHRQAVMLGALGVVVKDEVAEVLIQAIEQVNRGQAWLKPELVAAVIRQVSTPSRPAPVDPEQAHIASLSAREREVIALVGEGLKNREIAERLSISDATVNHHLTAIYQKLNIANRLELMVYGFRHGLIQPNR